MRVLFAGTPPASLPSLDAVAASSHELVAVLTRPDAAAGRGRRLVASPVKLRAEELGVPVLTPTRPRDPDFLDRLRTLAPDACPIVAYGALIPPAALEVPPHGWVNLHFSLLPAWRGAAPVQRAVMAGDELTGATTFRLEAGLDSGPTYGLTTEQIGPEDTAGDLLARLAISGAQLLVATLDALEDGSIAPRPQPAEGVSLAPKIEVADARVRWDQPAMVVDRRVRGCTPAPGAWTTFRGERMGVQPARLEQAQGGALAPGQIRAGRTVLVGTATTPVRLTSVQPPGRRAMPAADWARGARLVVGERFGDE